MDKIDVSIVIVSWNSWEFLPECLESVFCQYGVAIEVILVDNASRDRTTARVSELFGRVKLISNSENLGYARACNQGMNMACGEFVFLLNPDTVLSPESLSKMVAYLRENQQLGALGPQLLGADGKIQASCRRFPNYLTLVWEFTGLSRLFPGSRVFGSWRMGDFDFRTLREVDQPMASALLVRRTVIEKVGFMDERFRMFFNDVDFCFRIKRAGFKIAFYPEARVTHHLGGSTKKRRIAMVVHTHLGFFKYLKKYYSSGPKFLLLIIFGLGLIVSAVLRIIFINFTRLLERIIQKPVA